MNESKNDIISIDKKINHKIESENNNSTELMESPANEFESDEEIGLFSEKFRRIFIKNQSPQLNNATVTQTKNDTTEELAINKNTETQVNIKIEEKLIKKNYTLSIVDTFIAVTIIGPLVIGHWRGIWSLMDFYKLPNGWTCFIIGTGLHGIFAILRENFHKKFAVSWRTSNPLGHAGYRAIRLIYTWLFCVACNMQWRGGWDILASFTPNDYRIIGSVTCIMISMLVCLRCSRNLLAPPCIVIVDIPNQIFRFPTRYKKVSCIIFHCSKLNKTKHDCKINIFSKK